MTDVCYNSYFWMCMLKPNWLDNIIPKIYCVFVFTVEVEWNLAIIVFMITLKYGGGGVHWTIYITAIKTSFVTLLVSRSQWRPCLLDVGDHVVCLLHKHIHWKVLSQREAIHINFVLHFSLTTVIALIWCVNFMIYSVKTITVKLYHRAQL